MDVPESLSESISMAPSSLQTTAEPSSLHHSLASLPPEILELDDPDHDDPDRFNYRPNTSFPLVCRLFRTLELSIPSLWTQLTDDMTSDRISLHISRSGALRLKVGLSTGIDGGPGCLCEKWRLLAQSSHRWSILDVDVHGERQLEHKCFSTLRGISLPSLWSLTIVSIDDDMIPILSTWTTPSVQVVFSLKPCALHALPDTRSLTTLRLVHMSDSDVPGVDRLLDFLASAPQLTILQLTLYGFNVERGLPIRYKKRTLPMLHFFSLLCSDNEETAPRFMLRCIAMPNIRFVILNLWKDIADALIDWLPNLKNPSLRTVTVRILGDFDGTTQGRIVNAFQGNDGKHIRVEASISEIGNSEVKIEFT